MNNKENKNKDNNSNKQRNIILVIIATVLLLLILLIGIKSCSTNEPDTKLENYTITYYDELNQTNDNKTSITNEDTITLSSLDDREDNVNGYGYYFLGWYTDQEYTNKIDTLTNITSNINLYASYEKYSIGLAYSIIDGETYVAGIGTVGHFEIYIPSKIDGGDVVGIADNAFWMKMNITSIEIPSSITSIGVNAFSVCTSLTSIEIPNSITSIGEYAFSMCTALTSIEIPSNVTSIGEYTFSMCTALTSIEIPSSVTTIKSSAFSGCTAITSIEIPSSVTTIGAGTFDSCTSLTNITIPSSVTSIGESAFYNCTSLTIYTLLASKPDDWDTNWNSSNCEVKWGESAPNN